MKSIWLNILTMLRRGRWGLLAALCCWAMVGAGAAHAANINFNGSNTSPVCPLSGTTYTCATLPLGTNDTAVISSGYTVVVNSGVSLAYAQGLSMSGTAALQVKGSLDLSASNGLNVTGGSLSTTGNFKLGASAQSITANVSAATVTTGGASTYIGGTVTASGDINLGSSTTITGAVSTTGTGSLTTGSSSTLGPLSVKGSINLSSSNTINGSVTATSITTNSSVTINGSITLAQTSGGVADLGSGIKVNGAISAYSVQTTSPVTLNGDVSAVSSLTLASGSSVTGNIVSPVVTLNASNSTVKGNITASTSLDMGSGVAVTGTVNTGGLTMRASNAVINGNATVTGDVDMGSGTTINGDLSARNVNTRASNAVINGNAAVNAIYIDWGNSVTKTITCTGPGAAQCSCVTKADPNYKPTCGAAAPSGPDHIQITHDGKGLTCEPATVKLRACANSSCSVAYTGSTTVTLVPGGGQVTFTGDTSATVSQSSIGTTALSAGAGTQCVNTSTGTNSSGDASACNMAFAANGLIMSAPDHVSMTSAALSIQIKKAGPNNAFCVPLAQGSATLNFTCKYSDPVSGTLKLALGNSGAQGLCNGGNIPVDVSFDASGLASVPLQYPDVGLVNVTAAYSANAVDVAGSASFTAAPDKFQIVATAEPPAALAGAALNNSAVAFARSGDPFRLTVTALSAAGKATPNFGRESSAELFTMSPIVLKLPSDGSNPQATIGTFGNIVNGVGASTAGNAGLWVYNETGVITLNAKLSNSSSYYMGKTALNSFRTTGTVDLRFAPHHFDVLLLPGVPMNCNYVGGYSNPCKADTSSTPTFVYSGQPFAVQAKAYKDASTLSANYRLRTAGTADTEDVVRSITLSAASAAGGNVSSSFVSNAASNFVFATDAITHAGTGVATILPIAPATAPVLPSLQFTNNGPPYPSPTTIFLRVTDTDGASSSRAGSAEPPLTVVKGKMLINNAYGPANTAIPVEVRAMYWSGDANAWLFNPAFMPQSPALGAAAALQSTDGTFANCKGGLNCNNLSLKATTLQFRNGKALFPVAAPSPAASGTVQVGLKQSLNPSAPLFMDNNFPYLPIIDPGNITFGTARPSPVIYTREVYN